MVNGKDEIFDGAPLQAKWQYFIYDIAAGRRLFIAPQFSVNGDVHEALSPSGKKFLTFDGKAIRVYDVP